MRKTSEVMKTKSAVRPREIQITVLNLERPRPGVRRVKDATICLLAWIDAMTVGRGRGVQEASF